MKCQSEARQLNLDRLLKHQLWFLCFRGNIRKQLTRKFWNFYFQKSSKRLLITFILSWCAQIYQMDGARNFLNGHRKYCSLFLHKIILCFGYTFLRSLKSKTEKKNSKDTKFLRENNEDSDETTRMCRLIWVFVGAHVRRHIFTRCGSFYNPRFRSRRPSIKGSIFLNNRHFYPKRN